MDIPLIFIQRSVLPKGVSQYAPFILGMEVVNRDPLLNYRRQR